MQMGERGRRPQNSSYVTLILPCQHSLVKFEGRPKSAQKYGKWVEVVFLFPPQIRLVSIIEKALRLTERGEERCDVGDERNAWILLSSFFSFCFLLSAFMLSLLSDLPTQGLCFHYFPVSLLYTVFLYGRSTLFIRLSFFFTWQDHQSAVNRDGLRGCGASRKAACGSSGCSGDVSLQQKKRSKILCLNVPR